MTTYFLTRRQMERKRMLKRSPNEKKNKVYLVCTCTGSNHARRSPSRKDDRLESSRLFPFFFIFKQMYFPGRSIQALSLVA